MAARPLLDATNLKPISSVVAVPIILVVRPPLTGEPFRQEHRSQLPSVLAVDVDQGPMSRRVVDPLDLNAETTLLKKGLKPAFCYQR